MRNTTCWGGRIGGRFWFNRLVDRGANRRAMRGSRLVSLLVTAAVGLSPAAGQELQFSAGLGLDGQVHYGDVHLKDVTDPEDPLLVCRQLDSPLEFWPFEANVGYALGPRTLTCAHPTVGGLVGEVQEAAEADFTVTPKGVRIQARLQSKASAVAPLAYDEVAEVFYYPSAGGFYRTGAGLRVKTRGPVRATGRVKYVVRGPDPARLDSVSYVGMDGVGNFELWSPRGGAPSQVADGRWEVSYDDQVGGVMVPDQNGEVGVGGILVSGVQAFYAYPADSSDAFRFDDFQESMEFDLTVEPILPVVEVQAIEVIQSVQDWNNSVDWVAHKPTVVRVAALAKRAPDDRRLCALTGKLRAYREGAELAGSPWPARTGPITVETEEFLGGDWVKRIRGDMRYTLNFVLPPQWLQGNVELVFEGEATQQRGRDFEPITLVFKGGKRTMAAFQPVPPLELKLVQVALEPGSRLLDWRDIDRELARVREMYPLAQINATRHPQPLTIAESVPGGPNLPIRALEKLDSLRSSERPWLSSLFSGPGPVYLGLAPGSFGGVAYQPGRVAFASDSSQGGGNLAEVIAHELGHSLGRIHPVSADRPVRLGLYEGWCGEDPEGTPYPWFYQERAGGTKFPALGPMDLEPRDLIYGFRFSRYSFGVEDQSSVLSPFVYAHVMGYCNRGYRWVSSLTYEALLGAIRDAFPAPLTSVASAPQIILPRPPPESDRESLLVSGVIDLSADVLTLGPVLRLTAPPPASPEAGDYLIQLELVDGSSESIPFTPAVLAEAPNHRSFVVQVPADGVRRLTVGRAGKELARREASASAPEVHFLSPTGGELENEVALVQWAASDADGDALSFTVQFSGDGGAHWETMGVELDAPRLVWQAGQLPGTTNGLLRVAASDGFLTTWATNAAPLLIPDRPPSVTLDADGSDPTVVRDSRLVLGLTAYDPERGRLDGTNVVWRSDRDGVLGTGARLTRPASDLATGLHVITAVATDAAGFSVSTTTTIQVLEHRPSRFVRHELLPDGALNVVLSADPGATNVIEGSTDLRDWHAVSTNVLPAGLGTVSLDSATQAAHRFFRAVQP